MNACVEAFELWGNPALKLYGEGLEAWLLPALGGNLIRLRDESSGFDLLRTAVTFEDYQENSYLCGIPVLFPPNRIEDGVFSYNGHTYHLAINEPQRACHLHGFAHDKPWRVLSAGVVEGTAKVQIEWSALDFPDVQEQFPHAIRLRITYELRAGALWQHTETFNDGITPAPYGMGFHTNFMLPLSPGGDPHQCRLAISVDRQWELSERLLPTGRLLDLPDRPLWRDGKDITSVPLDDIFTAELSPSELHLATLYDDNCGLKVTYGTYGPIRHWVIFNRDGESGFVSVEPYTWVTNAPNLPLPAELTGFMTLAPGDRAELTSFIALARQSES